MKKMVVWLMKEFVEENVKGLMQWLHEGSIQSNVRMYHVRYSDTFEYKNWMNIWCETWGWH